MISRTSIARPLCSDNFALEEPSNMPSWMLMQERKLRENIWVFEDGGDAHLVGG